MLDTIEQFTDWTLCRNWFRMRLLFLSSDGNWRLCCSSRPSRPTDNMFRAVYQQRTPAWLLTLTESDCTVVMQQKCDNATLIIFFSTTSTSTSTTTTITTCLPSAYLPVSVRQNAATCSPLASWGRYFAFCSSDANIRIPYNKAYDPL